MVHSRLVVVSSLLLAVSDAFIRFEHSIIYDEFDFAGQKSISVPLSCTESGCRIYISMPEASKTIASNLMIADKITLRTRFSDVALMKQRDGQKGFYNIRKGNQFVNFTNQNADLKSAPIMLWIVQGDAPNIDNAQVYDAALFYRSPARAGLITVMNTEPFTLTTDTRGPMIVSAKLSGFDLFDNDACTTVLEQNDPSSYQELALSIRGPIITLSFDGDGFPDTTVAMNGKVEQVDSFDLGKPMFATSPGYVCGASNQADANGTTSFRSSLYNSAIAYHFASDRMVDVDLTADLDLDARNPLIITDETTGAEYKWSGSAADGTNEKSATLRTSGITIKWNSPRDDADQYFLLRVVAVTLAKSTTSFPEADEAKTTTHLEPESSTDSPDFNNLHSSSMADLDRTTASTRRTIGTTSKVTAVTTSRSRISTTASTSTTGIPTTSSTAASTESLIIALFLAILVFV